MQFRTAYRTAALLCFFAGLLLAALVLRSRHQASNRTFSSPAMLHGPIRIIVTGHDFFWHFRFPGPDDVFHTRDDVTVDKELHLPLSRDVVFLVTSDDYIYTLSIPALKLRSVAVPDLTYPLEFRTERADSFDVVADPMCGVRLFHDGAMAKIVVQSQPGFEAWYRKIQ